ncbi:hypothetical protein LCGC14_2367550 [marine sediment metagenome]|uniref:Uncharacterized protein n=1 Tax=marine sediment metagenome TaxID=412755 RepID=A0A0F9C514_9ZZZZ
MKALSIRQPWAWLIVHGWKDIENRTRLQKFRGRIYVHAGQKYDYEGLKWLATWLAPEIFGMISTLCVSKQTGLVGEIDIVDSTVKSESPWFTGPYGYVLANPLAYEVPIPYKGRLGLFEVTLPQEAHHAD